MPISSNVSSIREALEILQSNNDVQRVASYQSCKCIFAHHALYSTYSMRLSMSESMGPQAV